ncbi:hypothetical protein PR048_011756 [Dryococelus australis]|uniref:Uncharacterized protein n=1 Tax=Dryococelus australis TaxID=614101 RepID=A0ABQ9HMI7_9NEOP|nr:hypothetical protein PR048_011756 [Dryococelus australis]
MGPVAWPPHSLDLSPNYFFLVGRGIIKGIVYSVYQTTREDMKDKIRAAWGFLSCAEVHRATANLRRTVMSDTGWSTFRTLMKSDLFFPMLTDFPCKWGHGGRAVSLLASIKGETSSIPGRFTQDICKCESGWTMPLVGGFSRRSPVSPTVSFRRCFILTPIAQSNIPQYETATLFIFTGMQEATLPEFLYVVTWKMVDNERI